MSFPVKDIGKIVAFSLLGILIWNIGRERESLSNVLMITSLKKKKFMKWEEIKDGEGNNKSSRNVMRTLCKFN